MILRPDRSLNDEHSNYFHNGFLEDIAMNAQHTNENLTVHFKVKDYATWRTGYDAHEKGRLSAGISNGRVFRSPEDPNDVVILQDAADVSKARSWLTSDDTKA